MKLHELASKLMALCRDGHSMDEVLIDVDGNNTHFADIEVRRVDRLSGKKKQISLVAWRPSNDDRQ
jgi:hypothetical protein